MKNVLVTGGLGFIGSRLSNILRNEGNKVVVFDKQTYAANDPSVLHKDIKLIIGDICDYYDFKSVLAKEKFDWIIHTAAESHVDNSIESSKAFIDTNVMGTYTVLDAIKNVSPTTKIIYMSTDEVYGEISECSEREHFKLDDPINPSSPYSATKAAGELALVAYNKTFGVKGGITRCTNNFGINQNIEKMIPKTIKSIVEDRPVIVYGEGKQERDWLPVDWHCRAIIRFMKVIEGDDEFINVWNIGAGSPISNMDLIHKIHNVLKRKGLKNNLKLEFVEDRLGHDFKYSIADDTISNLGINTKCVYKELVNTIIHYYDMFTGEVK